MRQARKYGILEVDVHRNVLEVQDQAGVGGRRPRLTPNQVGDPGKERRNPSNRLALSVLVSDLPEAFAAKGTEGLESGLD